ncbi:hypothetical protein QL093DRAFT_2591123 [Fusarium oxysporum]|nr:hypothetical protein QL093DRAFT_2591123 [Fusarium oxysporum]
MEHCREECARSIREATVEGFSNPREPIRHAVNDGLQDGIREGKGIMRDTIRNSIQAEIRLAQEKIVDTVNTRNNNSIDSTDTTGLALRWWDEFLRHIITISVFGGSITLTVIVQAIQDPAELNKDSRFHHDTFRIFLTVAWLLFVSALALALSLWGGGLPSIMGVLFHILSFLLCAVLLGAFIMLSLCVVAYVEVVGWIGFGVTSGTAIIALFCWLRRMLGICRGRKA